MTFLTVQRARRASFLCWLDLLDWLADHMKHGAKHSSALLVFGDRSGNKFSENSRYLFQYMSKYSNKNCVWLTKKKKIYNILKKRGYKCYLNYSLKGLYFGFRAKWHIFNYSTNDTSNFSSMGANHLNLWTGFQIKKLSKFKEKNFFLINCFVNLLSKDRYFLYPDISHFKNIEKHYKKGHYKLLETKTSSQTILFWQSVRQKRNTKMLLWNCDWPLIRTFFFKTSS